MTDNFVFSVRSFRSAFFPCNLSRDDFDLDLPLISVVHHISRVWTCCLGRRFCTNNAMARRHVPDRYSDQTIQPLRVCVL